MMPVGPPSALLGYRTLVYHASQFYSPIFWELWPGAAEIYALCYQLLRCDEISVPAEDCTCGIYVARDIHGAKVGSVGPGPICMVVARLSGRIIIHEDGQGTPAVARGQTAQVQYVVREGYDVEKPCRQYFGVPHISKAACEDIVRASWTEALAPQQESTR